MLREKETLEPKANTNSVQEEKSINSNPIKIEICEPKKDLANNSNIKDYSNYDHHNWNDGMYDPIDDLCHNNSNYPKTNQLFGSIGTEFSQPSPVPSPREIISPRPYGYSSREDNHGKNANKLRKNDNSVNQR